MNRLYDYFSFFLMVDIYIFFQFGESLYAEHEEMFTILKELPSKKRKRVLENIYEESKKFKDDCRLDDSALLEEASVKTLVVKDAPPTEYGNNQAEAIKVMTDNKSDRGSEMSLGSIIDNIELVMDQELSDTSTPSSKYSKPPTMLFASWATEKGDTENEEMENDDNEDLESETLLET